MEERTLRDNFQHCLINAAHRSQQTKRGVLYSCRLSLV